MKAVSKILLLFIVVGLIIFGLWKILDTTLFTDEDNERTVATDATSMTLTHTNTPKISQAEAFESTSEQSASAKSNTLSCLTANPIISKLYDIRTTEKSLDDALDYLENNEKIPEEQYDNFVNFANSLWDTPKHKLLKKEAFLEQFNASCSKIEAGSQ